MVLIDVQYSRSVAFSFKKGELIKFTSPQIPTKQYNRKTQQNVLSLILGDFSQWKIDVSKVNLMKRKMKKDIQRTNIMWSSDQY